MKTATEVSSDNSALMRNIKRHENLLEGSLANIAHAVMAVSRVLGEDVPNEGDIHVTFDDLCEASHKSSNAKSYVM